MRASVRRATPRFGLGISLRLKARRSPLERMPWLLVLLALSFALLPVPANAQDHFKAPLQNNRHWYHFSKRTLIAGAALAGAMITDGESTISVNHRCPIGCPEMNPLLSRNPSRAQMYSIGAPILLGHMFLAQKMQQSKYRWVRRVWFVPMVIETSFHVRATIHNRAISAYCPSGMSCR